MESNELSGKRIALWAGVALLITAVLVIAFRFVGTNESTDGSSSSVTPVTEQDYVLGNKDSTVILVEYSDFQCPACALYAPVVDRVVEEYSDRIAFVYRHFPLSYHLQAEPAAQAAEAAGKQGKFWEMYDLLFEKQSEWAEKSDAKQRFENYARDLGLNIEKYASDVNAAEIRTKIREDYQGGIKAGVNATPTFYLNGKKLQNVPADYQRFKQVIDAELATTT